MQVVNLLQAKLSFSRMVEATEQGQEREIVIARNGFLVAKLVPMESTCREAYRCCKRCVRGVRSYRRSQR